MIVTGVIRKPKYTDILPGMWVQLANGWIVGPVVQTPCSGPSVYVSAGSVDGQNATWQVYTYDDWEFRGKPIGIREVVLCGWPDVASSESVEQ